MNHENLQTHVPQPPLIAEDIMLLMLDDDSGKPVALSMLHIMLGGAALMDLAVQELISVDDSSRWKGAMVSAKVGVGTDDDILQGCLEYVAKRPWPVTSLPQVFGAKLYKQLTDRLVARGYLTSERSKWLGIFPTTRHPAAPNVYEPALRRDILQALSSDTEAQPRVAAVIAILSASNALKYVLKGASIDHGEAKRRAKRYQEGEWGGKVVGDAIRQAQAAIAASTSAAVSAATIAAVSSTS